MGIEEAAKILSRKQPEASWPSRRTVSDILKREGCTCYPLTVTDRYSRYLLGCNVLKSTGKDGASGVFKELFRKYGLPAAIRSDNGTPFASTALARLSELSVWWIRLGIRPELIEPGNPQQNGQHEGIGLRMPAELYSPSKIPMPEVAPDLIYPAHFETRLVSRNGGFRWQDRWVCVSTTCAGQRVGLEETGDGVWDVFLGPVKLGRFLEEKYRIEDHLGRLRRNR